MGKGEQGRRQAGQVRENGQRRPGEAQGLHGQVRPGGGGTVQPVAEGGNFYIDADGGKVFITNGGKVFG